MSLRNRRSAARQWSRVFDVGEQSRGKYVPSLLVSNRCGTSTHAHSVHPPSVFAGHPKVPGDWLYRLRSRKSRPDVDGLALSILKSLALHNKDSELVPTLSLRSRYASHPVLSSFEVSIRKYLATDFTACGLGNPDRKLLGSPCQY